MKAQAAGLSVPAPAQRDDSDPPLARPQGRGVRVPAERTRVWRVLHDAADCAAVLLARDERRPVDEFRARMQLAVEQVDRLFCRPQLAAFPPAALPAASDVRALRTEFLTQVEAARHSIDARTLARVVGAFDKLLERVQELELVRRPATAEAVEEMLDIAHDMQSPLSSILFLTETLRRAKTGPVNAVQERQLGLIYSAAFGLSALVSDVIDGARGHRLVAGRPLPFSIAETMLHVCAIVRPIAEEKGLDLETVFPTFDGRRGYGSAIARVLLNLTTNALKFTEYGSVTIGCSELSDTEVEFWVADTGPGLREPLQVHVAEAGDSSQPRPRFSSSGLGLTICRTLLEALGSSLEAQTEPNAGTRFSFRLVLPRAD